MNKHHSHNDIIEKKLEQLPLADTDQLWNEMHSILDKKMPPKKERRRVMFWFLISKPFLLLTAGFIIGMGATLFFLSENSPQQVAAIRPGGDQTEKLNDPNSEEMRQQGSKQFTITGDPKNIENKKSDKIRLPENSLAEIIHKTFVGAPSANPSVKYFTPDDGTNYPYGNLSHSNADTRADVVIDAADLKFSGIMIPRLDYRSLANRNTPQLKSGKESRDRSLPAQGKGFYAGIITGIDLSSVRFQPARAGSSKGILIGYSLNNRWSIESGLLWDTKRMFDDGSFFDPPAYTPASGIKIIAVNGRTRLYEIPLNVKYTVTKGKNNLFATTGLSSYIMRAENYDYEYTQNGQPGGHNYLSYKNETKNWFSVANFSLGYTRQLGAAGSLRIEPYLKIPLKELGTSNMPITSTGLNIGFTKPIR